MSTQSGITISIYRYVQGLGYYFPKFGLNCPAINISPTLRRNFTNRADDLLSLNWIYRSLYTYRNSISGTICASFITGSSPYLLKASFASRHPTALKHYQVTCMAATLHCANKYRLGHGCLYTSVESRFKVKNCHWINSHVLLFEGYSSYVQPGVQQAGRSCVSRTDFCIMVSWSSSKLMSHSNTK